MGWLPKDDLTSAIGAPLAFGNPVCYVFAQFTQHIIYVGFTEGVGPNGRIHELYWDGNGWHHNDLTAAAGAPLAFFDNIKAYVFFAEGTQHVVYLGLNDQGLFDSHVHELYWNNDGWHHNDLTAAAGAPLALSTPTGYEFRKLEHVVHGGNDGHVYELWHDSNGWHYNDLTGAPVVAEGPLTAHVFAALGTQHVVYLGGDLFKGLHIHELHWDNSGWHQSDLTIAAAAPLASDGHLTDYAFEDQDTQHINYVGKDGHTHELWWDYDNGWHHNDLTAAAGAPLGGRPTGYVFKPDETQHVVYAGTDGHIHELSRDNSGWHHDDLTIATGAAPAGGDPTGYEFTPSVGQGTQRVVYTSSDHHIIQLQRV
jgi:hypothetical protein